MIFDNAFADKYPNDEYPRIKLELTDDFPKSTHAILSNTIEVLRHTGYSPKEADEFMKCKFGKTYEEAKE